jgi:hypothetical protein
MNIDVQPALDAVCAAGKAMAPRCLLILTLKLARRSASCVEQTVGRARRGLEALFDIEEVTWLFANRLRERTLLARKKLGL